MKKSLYAAAGKIFLMSAMITMMSSCSIYRKYHRPEDLPTDSLYRADLVDTTGFSTAEEDTTSLGYLPWEEVFTDPDLQVLIRQGLEHNTDLQAAILSVEQARAQLMASRWAYVPSINLAPQGGLSSIDGGKATWTYNVNGSVSWDVDLFGSLLNSKRGAQATLLQQEAYRQAVRSQIIGTIATSYYALMALSPIPDELPDALYHKYGMPHHERAYRMIHFPDSLENAKKALRTLAFTELFMLEIGILRESRKQKTAKRSIITPLEKKLIASLPFSLTDDQMRCAEEIREDMDSGNAMNRLLQGDVGSGKTLVAWITALHAIAGGGQVAFMAPTELLARQHADGAAALLSPLGIRIAFIAGSVKGESRRLLLKSLKEGTTDLVIGTHALFSEDVEFRRLSYVIIDEQHRFGVQQREALMHKGKKASILSMSATPIPRSLALTLYASYSVSTLHTMPSGRKPITTYLVRDDRRDEMYKAVGVEFSRGHQAYFVYPRIDDDGESELRDVTTMYEVLRKEYPGVSSGLIHSKLPDDEKMRILHGFQNKEISYLVATSVVEVGIDIPDATCMVIEHAERFGLAALHQLRGRVGRSSLPSYCFLVYGKNLTEEAKARLRVMKETTDGFRIAEKDLEIRGPGDITGDRQSGFLRLKFASLTSDLDIVEKARYEAEKVVEEDRGLLKAENAVIRRNLYKYIQSGTELEQGAIPR